MRDVTALAISPAALAPLRALPFKATVAAPRPTRQAVLDEIDRLAEAGVQGHVTMSDAPASPPPSPQPAPVDPRPVQVRRGIGVFGAFVTGLVAAVIVLAGALISLPFWPEQVRVLWRGETGPVPAPTPGIDLQAVRADAAIVANAAVEAAKRDLNARLDDLEKRLRAVSATAAERPTSPDPALAELRGKVEALENRPAASTAPADQTSTDQGTDQARANSEKEIAPLKAEIASLRSAVQALDQSVAGQREQAKTLSDAVAAHGTSEQKALTAARGSALVGVAARLSTAIEDGLPLSDGLAMLEPLMKDDAKLGEIAAALKPYSAGVTSRAALTTQFPAMAKAALADDVADNSFGARVLGKIRGIVSLRRVGDVEGDTTEAKLARAEAALKAGDLAKAVELVKSLPAQTAKATAAWLARARGPSRRQARCRPARGARRRPPRHGALIR